MRRVIDAYASCQWPLGPEAYGSKEAAALLAMIDGEENLPQDVRKFMSAYAPMSLRLRYAGAGTTGPYLINDIEEVYDRETLEKFFDTLSDKELRKYLSAPMSFTTNGRHIR